MAFLCFSSIDGINYSTSQVATTGECINGFIAQSALTYVDPTALNDLFKLYFEFDPALFSQLLFWNLLSFISGHILGRVMQVFRKSL